MPDKVEHRGFVAFQSIYNNFVGIFKDGRAVKKINTKKRQTKADMMKMIDEYIEERGGE